MPRIRSIKPEIWVSPQVMALSHGARLLFVGLITQADDEGRGLADPKKLKATIFGGDDEVTTSIIRQWLDECSTNRLAVVYTIETGELIYQLLGWKDHQSIDRPTKSRYPPPPKPEPLVEGSTNPREGSEGSEGSDLRHIPRAREGLNGHWSEIQSAYPAFSGQQNWITAEHNAHLLVDQSIATVETLLQSVTRYRKFVDAGGVSSSRYVLTPAKFFAGATGPWSQEWKAPTEGQVATESVLQFEALCDRNVYDSEGSRRDGQPMPPRVRAALERIGGWSRIRLRSDRDEKKLRSEFCAAYQLST